jgi:hypothetical protein
MEKTLTLPKQITSMWPPTIFISPNDGKTYACPMWIEIPVGTSLNAIRAIWVQDRPNGLPLKDLSLNQVKEYKIPNSKGNGFYTVTEDMGTWKCECTGFGFKGTCKHTGIAKGMKVT